MKCIIHANNCRTFEGNLKLTEIKEDTKKLHRNVTGLAETIREGEGYLETEDETKFFYDGEGSVRGTCFLVNGSIA